MMRSRAGTTRGSRRGGRSTIDPARSVLHYAQEIFEGLKAYRRPDGGFALFRPDANARRFNASARRMAMPDLPEEMFLESIRALVRADKAWIPPQRGRRALPAALHVRERGLPRRASRRPHISTSSWPPRSAPISRARRASRSG